MIFGGAIAGPLLGELTWQVVLYAVASLTVVQMMPVALALVGTGLRIDTVALLGWFGPRGLVSIVYGLAAVETLGDDGTERDVLVTVGGTVLLSIIAHGVTAQPLGHWYARQMQTMRPDDAKGQHPELRHAHDLPTRPSTDTSPTRTGAGRPNTASDDTT